MASAIAIAAERWALAWGEVLMGVLPPKGSGSFLPPRDSCEGAFDLRGGGEVLLDRLDLV